MNSLRTQLHTEFGHAFFLMLRILFHRSVEVCRCMCHSVKVHRHGRTVLKGMVLYYIESRSLVFVFRMIPSTRSVEEARSLSHKGKALSYAQPRSFFNCGDPAELVQMRTPTVYSVRHGMAYSRDAGLVYCSHGRESQKVTACHCVESR